MKKASEQQKFLDIENNTYYDFSSEENYNNGIAVTRLSKSVFEKLVKISKLKGVKLTGTLSSIILTGLQEMYKKFLGKNALKPILYHIMVNIRSFLEPLVDNYMMGYYTTSLLFTNNEEIYKNSDKNNWKDNFWRNSLENTKDLHDRIKAGAHLDKFIHGNITEYKSFASYTSLKDDYLSLFAFNFSNLGNLTLQSETKNKLIKLKDHFSEMNVKKNLTIW